MTDGRSNLSDFTAVQRVRGDLSDAVQSSLQSGHGRAWEKVSLLRGVLREGDRTMESSSEGFLAANRNFSQATCDIESMQAGREATTRGRSEDIIPAYQALRPQGQAAFRAARELRMSHLGLSQVEFSPLEWREPDGQNLLHRHSAVG
jgi:hypothetical protein